MRKINLTYNKLNALDYKTIPSHQKIIYEFWFMFIDEIARIQEQIIKNWGKQCDFDTLSSIELLQPPHLTNFQTFMAPENIKLCVSSNFFN
ncbi:hypothetical protein DH26_gp038 [Chloriridovirus anopheles1]|uniref:Uncharacterized protein n=1 Tax=Chloriridovirus anopheles1 TaxID=1465751 RepID=W8QE27_9VIRU|nr:hypothetical protein DH26_gp038 [Anopheles minimus iridovirus]AHL67535.1 hypothetical protein AMIV_038 [Anopheles minimus iridovirus]